MKITWTWVGVVLLVFIAFVSFLWYLLAQGAVMSIPLILLIWELPFAVAGLLLALLGRQVGCHERRKADRIAAPHSLRAEVQKER